MPRNCNQKESNMDMPIVARTIEDAANEGYRIGFAEGYAAARTVLKTVVEAWRAEPQYYDLEGALQALDMSREEAAEMLGLPKFKICGIAPAADSTDTMQ